MVNEQLVLSETQCGHVQTRRCPCPAPRCPYCCQTAPGAGLSGIFWDVSSWKQLGHTHKNKKKNLKKRRALCKNNPLVEMLRGRDTPSSARWVTPEVLQDGELSLCTLLPQFCKDPGVQATPKDGNCKVLGFGCCKVLWSLFPLFEWILLLPQLSLLPKEVGCDLEGFPQCPKNVNFFPTFEIHVEMNSPCAVF